MTNEELKNLLTAKIPSITFEEGGEWLNAFVDPASFLPAAKILKEEPELLFDYLFCLTCVDWKTHLTMVYHLESKKYRHRLVVKSKLDRNNPDIESVSHIWKTAELLELEVYDLFGVKFQHHPGLRRLILTDDWVGWPLRKDYEDPINIIKL